jgi:hypothetical protein
MVSSGNNNNNNNNNKNPILFSFDPERDTKSMANLEIYIFYEKISETG